MSISSTEIIIVALVALIALGPQRLPEALRTAGKLYRQFKEVSDSVQREVTSVVNETTGMVTGTRDMMTKPISDMMKGAPMVGPAVANQAFRPTDAGTAAGSEVRPADEVASARYASDDVVPADVFFDDVVPADELDVVEFSSDEPAPADETEQ